MKEYVAIARKKIKDAFSEWGERFSKWLNKKVNYLIVAHFLINKGSQDESDLIIERAIADNRLQDLEDKIGELTDEVDKIQLKKDRKSRLDYVQGRIQSINDNVKHLTDQKEPLVIERDILHKKIKGHYQGL
jgi:DNA repair exonuclease SbcCD ATPase subunit